MKITELINELLTLKNAHGDIHALIGGSFRGIPHADLLKRVDLAKDPDDKWIVVLSANVPHHQQPKISA